MTADPIEVTAACATTIRTRNAEARDVPALWRLMQQLAVFEGYAPQFQVTERDLLQRGLAPGAPRQFTAIVSESTDGDLVGYAVVYQVPFTYDLRPTLVLKELYVDVANRSAGVGSALMSAVLAHARTACCGRLRWQVLPTNERAKAFYRRFGGRRDAQWESWILE